MAHELTHASFFSGVGGLDLGLERAGWRTVSFSEIDPYASAVLAERWPGVPNLGDIVELCAECASKHGQAGVGCGHVAGATLWSGGFPCQDLSVAGKRAGFAGERSSLAFAFLDLVERHRPPAILLENVPGLLSSHGGRDFGRLLGEMGQLGYGWAYRILDARFFGVPQRRRRVFIVGLHAGTGLGADGAAAVLSVGTRCGRHPATGHAAGEGAAASPTSGVSHALNRQHGVTEDGTGRGVPIFNATAKFGEFIEDDTAGNLSARDYKSSNHLIGPSPDPGGVRAADGLAGRLDDLAPTLRVGPQKPQDGGPGDTVPIVTGGGVSDSELLPLGLDSHRYHCCGNGVVASVSEWIGLRLAEVLA